MSARPFPNPLFCAVLWASLLAPAVCAASLLDDALQAVAAHRGGPVAFREEKRLGILATPAVSRGTLSFTPPDRLEQDTEAPRRERLVVAGDTATIVAEGVPSRTIALAAAPPLRAVAETIRAALSGDAATLRRLFEVREEGSAGAWRFLLVPREPALRSAIARITLDGAGSAFRQIDVQQADGDEQRIEIGAGS